MNVLAIGNSFSEDAMRYLHEMAKKEGEKIDRFHDHIPDLPGKLFARI